MILAAPLVIPFAEAIGVSIAALGMAKATDKVNEFIQENPEQSIKIFQMIMPSQGIANALKNESSEGDEDLSEDMDEEVEVEKDTRSKKEIVLEEVARGRAGKGNFSSPDAVGPAVSITGNVKRGLRDAGKIRKGPDPNYDASKKFQGYKRFIRPKKADGGAIGIEVLFEEKKPRKDFNIGGQAQKTNTTPYDPRASIMDYGAALNKVGAGTQAEKSKSLGQYAKNYFTGLGEAGLKKLNPSVRSLAASYGIGKPISKFSELSPEVGQSLQGAIMQTLKDPRSSGISLKNIPVSSYTSYFKDRGVANTAGLYDTGYNSFGDQLKDMAAALAGDASAIARTTYGRFNVDINPEARTGFLRDTYDFEKKMPGSTAYGINMALPQKFVDEILNSPEYQKTTGYKPPSQYPDYKTAALQSQYYKNNPSNLDSDLFRAAYARALPDSGIKTRITNEGQVATDYGNYDPSRVYSAYMGNTGTSSSNPFFDQFKGSQYADMPTIMEAMYGTPGNINPYYADGGRVGFFMGGPALEGPALGIYNSMKAYQSFTDQEIANAIKEAGYELPTSSTPPDSSTPSVGDNLGITNNDRSVALPIGSVTGSGLVGDYMAATQDRQNRLTNPNKVQSFINNFTGGGQADIGEMIRTGQVDTRKTSGIPLGIGSLLSQILPDKYYDMSLADQVFTQSQMGYTGPTVFGENRTGNYKDPFGLNVRSAFGNYAEAVGKNFDQLRGTLTKDREGVTFNEETGLFEGVNADAVNKQTEMIRNKYNFRKQQLGVKNVLDSQIKSAGAQREKDYAAALEKARLERIAKQQIADAEKAARQRAQEEAIARDIARDMQESNRAGKTGGYQAGYDRDFMDGPSGGGGNTGGSPGSSGPGGSDSMGSFARGGLAAMFKKKR
jgi:hypothetical protein